MVVGFVVGGIAAAQLRGGGAALVAGRTSASGRWATHRPRHCMPVRTRGRWVACAATESGNSVETAEVAEELWLTRDQLRSKGKVKRTTSLGELDLLDYGEPDTPVNIVMVVKKVRSDYYVRGTVKSKITCKCDRCGGKYEHRGKSTVEIWLATNPDGEPRLASEDDTRADEVVEKFTPDVEKISLKPHIYDGVVMTVPMKKLCRANCGGDLPAEGLPDGLAVEFLQSTENEEFEEEDMGTFDDMDLGMSQRKKLLRNPNEKESVEHKLDPETVAMLRQWEQDLREKDKKRK